MDGRLLRAAARKNDKTRLGLVRCWILLSFNYILKGELRDGDTALGKSSCCGNFYIYENS